MGDTPATTNGLEITVDHAEGGTLVRLNGRVDIYSSPVLRDRLIALLGGRSPQPVEVDLANASYVDASGIATLVEGLRIARNRQTKLCLKGLQGRMFHLFEVAGIQELFARNGCGSTSSPPKGF